MLNNWQAYIIAIAIGLLIGIEREKAHPDQKSMGVRTFLLVSLLGAVAGGLNSHWLASLAAIFAFGLVLISYFNQTRLNIKVGARELDLGLTTEFAGGIVFCLGYMAHSQPALSATLGPIVAVVLFSKSSLHGFTQKIKMSELEAALLLALAAVVIVTLVPDKTIDPWEVFNPKKFSFLILTIAALEFSSYVLAKIVGTRAGSLLVGFLGGLVSSTAVLLTSARRAAKSPEAWRTFSCSAIAAKIASFMQGLLIVGLVAPEMILRLATIVGAGIAVGGIALVFLAVKKDKHQPELDLKSPLEWKGVLRLSLLLATILALISIAQIWLGDNATYLMSFLAGLFELHGVSLANATMFTQQKLTLDTAIYATVFAVIASLVAKTVMSWIITRGTFSRVISVVFLLMASAIGSAAWFLR